MHVILTRDSDNAASEETNHKERRKEITQDLSHSRGETMAPQTETNLKNKQYK